MISGANGATLMLALEKRGTAIREVPRQQTLALLGSFPGEGHRRVAREPVIPPGTGKSFTVAT
jgi:hypothetical protein